MLFGPATGPSTRAEALLAEKASRAEALLAEKTSTANGPSGKICIFRLFSYMLTSATHV
jgi:hypothetical protein